METRDQAIKLIEENYDIVTLAVRTSRAWFSEDSDLKRSVANEAVWQAALEWEGKGEFRAFAHKFIHRRIIDEARKRYGRSYHRLPPLAVVPSESMIDSTETTWTLQQTSACFVDNLLSYIDRERDYKYLKFLWSKLNSTQRRVATIRMQGTTLKKAGEMIGISEGRVCQIETDIKNKLSYRYSNVI